jgi:energy-coupling factor transport system ATP-binding protein
MTFSYSVDGKSILDSVTIPLKQNSFIILTGVENQAFSLIGGIVAGLFPLGHEEQVPRLEELIHIFKGTLEIKEGRLPNSRAYLGPDPEKHLLFSRVDEEVGARPAVCANPDAVLARFELPGGFKYRRISSLSGGEKMRLALAIAFSKSAECTVLHGVVPWLDKDGKQCLLREIEIAKSEHRTVLLLEQEIEGLRHLADCVRFFDGKTLKSTVQDAQLIHGEETRRAVHVIRAHYKEHGTGVCAVEFKDIDFRYNDAESSGFHIDKLSFRLESSCMYGLIGDNGAGKSTIANLILRLLRPSGGHIYIHGSPLQSMGRKEIMEQICYMSQFPEQQIMLSSVHQYRNRMKKRGSDLSLELLDSCFDTKRDYPLSLLTPLEMKLLTLASSVTEKTRLLILDEPTWGIDSNGLNRLLEYVSTMLSALAEPTLLIITHDVALIQSLGAVLLRLKQDGLITRQQQWDSAAYTSESDS